MKTSHVVMDVLHTPREEGISLLHRAQRLLRQLRRWKTLHDQRRWKTLHDQRHQLASLSDAMLKDIGLSRADAEREASRPFWDDPGKPL
ncbi:hypothetical protein SF06_33700 [Pseudomonas flexibilis]|uniref:Uncharacterized conserved protein YjiS, DUF1127 family n=1 Tax=Pseudomonas flexibilis TaxID=706570 RepID=A0A1N7B4U5_9PSED|nr:DUF1127 domain-containing protein [Pseudomonas flexibilis]KHL67845.1 hypothetical protein SF06_33700 [Pseudomonas flexibilis]SIR46345.1 Uncharacterized conserved protein YjiS, DUF1127 family [Pseudomonas flexibilis]